MKTIDRDDLSNRIAQGDTLLVEVLPPEMFRKFPIRGAVNVPYGEGFDEQVQKAVPDKSQEVIVYCADIDCDASPQAAKRMDELGYRNVFDYAAGKKDWRAAGLPIER